jgi:uncharacterized membrane protein
VGDADDRLERLVGRLLQAGVILSAVVVAFGGAVYLARHGQESADYSVFHGEPADLRSPAGVVTDAFRGHARGIIQLGILILLATPVGRVAFTVVTFAWRRDRFYTAVTLFVLGLLLWSLFAAVG